MMYLNSPDLTSLDLTESESQLVKEYLQEPEKFYNKYSIFKKSKSGKVKKRIIFAPEASFKMLLKKISSYLETKLYVSPYSIAWMHGKSREYVQKLSNKEFIIELDIKDFFPSVTAQKIEDELKKIDKYDFPEIKLSDSSILDARQLSMLFTVNDGEKRIMPQGYPTSPVVANFIRFPFDNMIAEYFKVLNKVESSQKLGSYEFDDDVLRYLKYPNPKMRCNFIIYGDNIIVGVDGVDMITSYKDGRPVKYGTEKIIDFIITKASEFGFIIPRKKVKVMPYYQQQKVLGYVINEKLNIDKQYKYELIGEIIKERRRTPSIIGKINLFRKIKPRDYYYLMELLNRVTVEPAIH